MATTVPAAQRKRKRSAKRNNQELPPPIHIDNNNNNIIKFEKKKAADVLPSPIDLDIDNNIIEYEILPKLPAKSICRFKSVSKHWKSFLSTPMFGKMHHHLHHISKSYKILLLDQPPVDLCCKPLNHGSITIGFNRLGKADPRFDLLLASLDGLVCVASTETINSLAFWNPFTGAYYKLPCNPNFTRPFDIDHDVLGFYSDNDDYKLLYKVFVDHWSCRVYIYSHRMNSWRNIEFLITGNHDPDPLLHHYPWSRATFCDHSLYFLVYKGLKDRSIIFCFDVNTEDFREMQFPPFLPSEARFYNHAMLMVIDGFIHLCVGYHIGCWLKPLTHGSMWKLNVDDGMWAEVAFFPARRHCDRNYRTCMTRNARGSCISISEGGLDNAPFRVMNMEEFTLTKHVWPMHTYRRIIYDETLVSPNPPYDDMVGHSNDAKATVAACKAADQAVNTHWIPQMFELVPQTGQQPSFITPSNQAADWEEIRYYPNKKTNQTSWEIPLELMTPVESAYEQANKEASRGTQSSSLNPVAVTPVSANMHSSRMSTLDNLSSHEVQKALDRVAAQKVKENPEKKRHEISVYKQSLVDRGYDWHASPNQASIANKDEGAVWRVILAHDGKTYYYNKKTMQSTWEIPLDVSIPLTPGINGIMFINNSFYLQSISTFNLELDKLAIS